MNPSTVLPWLEATMRHPVLLIGLCAAGCASAEATCGPEAFETMSSDTEVAGGRTWTALLAEEGCVVLTGPECEDVDGRYQGEGTTCDPHPCGPPRGACCLDSDCRLDTEENCERLGHGGEYLGNGVPCEPNPCNPTPTLRKSWGEVKSLYRTP